MIARPEPARFRSDSEPDRELVLSKARRASSRAAPARRLAFAELGRAASIAVGAVAGALLLSILLHLTALFVPTLWQRFFGDHPDVAHIALHGVQLVASLVLLAALVAWMRQSSTTAKRATTLEQAIGAMSAGVAIFDANDRLVACNDTYRDLYAEIAPVLQPGVDHAELLRAYHPVAPSTLVEGRSVEQFIGESLHRRDVDASVTDQVRYMRGQWVLMTDCRTTGGGMICLRTVLSDAGLRQLSLHRQRRAMDDLSDLTHDWFWHTDARGALVECSPALVDVFGQPLAAFLGRRTHELPGYFADEEQISALRRRVANREPFPWFLFRVQRPDGQTKWLAACGKPIFGTDDAFAGYYGAVRDVTEAESTVLQLRRDEERFRALAQLVTEWYWETDAQLHYTMVTGASGVDAEALRSMIGMPFGQSANGEVEPMDRELIVERMRSRDTLQRMPLRVFYDNGATRRVFEISAEPLKRGGQFVGYRGLSVDVSERQALIDRLTVSEARFRALTELSSDWFWEMDAEFRFTRVERGAIVRDHAAFLGPGDVIGKRRWELPGEIIQPRTWDEHRAVLQAHQPFRDLILSRRHGDEPPRYINSSGDPMFDSDGRFTGYRGVAKDITDLVRAKESIEQLAKIDALTRLANRHAFDVRARELLAQAADDNESCAMLFLDLDNFRLLNNGYGHGTGDAVLVEVARRLDEHVPHPRLLGRRGGDEMVALVAGLPNREAAVELARTLIDKVSEPIRAIGFDLSVTPSIGVAHFPQDGGDLEALINAADAAMYEAKQNGRATYAQYTAAVARRVELRLRLERRLRRAIEEAQDFRLFFQPLVSLSDGRVVGAEALMRWTDSELGEVSPAEFVPIAEESGLIVGLGDWVMREACRTRQVWRGMGLEIPPLAVNVSGLHLRQMTYVDTLLQTLSEHQVRAGEIEIEVTETGLIDTSALARENLIRLRNAGLKIALDDFGVGFSSLAHLRDLPIARLKIDRSFTVECMRDARTLTIVKAVIEMARSLGISVTAEGIETHSQQTWMQHLGCDSAQGFLFSRPLTAEEFLRLFVDSRGAPRERSLMH